ncbi:MAG: hypothetical protein R3190_01975 [Thermoanaerobaculia bacterium]|nr:hypothetical protein [Thermoanaerobaculia bacterium]
MIEIVLLVGLLALPAVGEGDPVRQDPPASEVEVVPSADTPGSGTLRLRALDEIFGTELPGVPGRGGFRLAIRPRWEEVVDQSVVRIPVDARWGIGERLQVWAGVVPFVKSPFRSDGSNGPGGGFFGFKRLLPLGPRDRIAAGVRLFHPLGSPDPEVSDGFARVLPFSAWTHEHGSRASGGSVPGSKPRPEVVSYVNFTVELVENPPWNSAPSAPRPHNRTHVRPGFLVQLRSWRYSAELQFSSDKLDGGDLDELFLRPGASWTPRPGTGENLGIEGRFELGAFLRIGLHDTERDLSVGGEVRIRFDKRRLLGRTSEPPPPAGEN